MSKDQEKLSRDSIQYFKYCRMNTNNEDNDAKQVSNYTDR